MCARMFHSISGWFLRPIQNQSGMGMVEMVLAASMSLVVLLGMYTAISDMNRSVVIAQVRMENVLIEDDIRTLYKDSANCLASFTDKKFSQTSAGVTPWESATLITSDEGDPQRITQIVRQLQSTNVVEYDVTNTAARAGASKVNRLTLQDYTPDIPPTAANDPNFYKGKAKLTIEVRPKSASIPLQPRSREIYLDVTLKKCSGCPGASNCDAECSNASTEDGEIKTCYSYGSSGGGSGSGMAKAAPPGFDCSTVGAEFVLWANGGCKWNKKGNYDITVPEGITSMKVYAIGGGGGSGSINNSAWSGYSGGAGGTAIKTIAVTPGTTYSFTVGGGGLGSKLSNGSVGWGGCGFSGSATIFNHSSGAIIGNGGGGGRAVLTVSSTTGNPTSCGNAAGTAGGSSGGDHNCSGGSGKYCSNDYFSCGGNLSNGGVLCDGQAGGRTGPNMGGAAASYFGGDGADFKGCGGGGAAATSPASDGSNGCLVLVW